MVSPDSPPIAQSSRPLSREEEADRTLRRTKVSRVLAAFIALVFSALIFAPPLVQHFRGPQPKNGDKDFWSLFPSWQRVRATTGIRSALLLLPTPQQTKKVESKIESDAILSQRLLPRSQNVMSKVFHAGNEQVFMGRHNWLFAKAEVDYLTGKGFLDPKVLRAAARSGVQPSPLRAIVDFNRQLRAHGITLIVMPIPSKATIHPGQFTGIAGARLSTPVTPENASFYEFESVLKNKGVLVYDPRATLLRARNLTRQAQYFPGDTHWTPQAMTRVARDLARFIRENVELPEREPVEYSLVPQREVNINDLQIMLKLPRAQTIFPHQTALTNRVLDDQGNLWKPQTDADILLLGDSFSNIYSRGGYWGKAAGLGEHLSFYLQRPVDRIAINGGGAAMIRQRWLSDLKHGKRNARSTRIVIYEFATRTLVNNDWKLLDFSPTLDASQRDSQHDSKSGDLRTETS